VVKRQPVLIEIDSAAARAAKTLEEYWDLIDAAVLRRPSHEDKWMFRYPPHLIPLLTPPQPDTSRIQGTSTESLTMGVAATAVAKHASSECSDTCEDQPASPSRRSVVSRTIGVALGALAFVTLRKRAAAVECFGCGCTYMARCQMVYPGRYHITCQRYLLCSQFCCSYVYASNRCPTGGTC
jgi:hypothetical protein